MLGSWNVIAYADDDNRNGMIEESEKYPIDSTEVTTLIFEKGDRYTYRYEELIIYSKEYPYTDWVIMKRK